MARSTNRKYRPRMLAACCLVMLSAAYSTQPAAGAIDTTHPFEIKPQTLRTALDAFSEQSRLQLFYSTGLVEGLRTSGVKGDLKPSDALKTLLKDSGLRFRVMDENTITLEQSNQGERSAENLRSAAAESEGTPDTGATESTKTTSLPKVTVSGEAAYDATDPYNTDYNRPNASTATKTDTPIIETPVSIQVVPQQVLKDQQAVRLQDALKNISGVQFTPSSGNLFDAFVIRGFEIDDNTRFRNGRRFPGVFKSDLANIEQVEVLKGPAAVLYGRIEPGGLVNLVTKKPLDQPYYALQQQFGSYDFYRTTVDATGPIDEAKTLLYRFNLGYTNAQSFRDELFTQALLISPSLTWRPTQATEINLNYEHREEDTLSDSGIPVDFADGNDRIPPISIRSQFTEPGLIDELDYDLVDLIGSHRFHALDADWTVRAGLQYQGIDFTFREISGGTVRADGRTLDRFRGLSNRTGDLYQAFLDFTGKFQLWQSEHTVLVGWDFLEDDREEPRFFDTAGQFVDSVAIDLFNPQFGRVDLAAFQAQPPEFFTKNGQHWHGVYFQDQITLWDKLHILGGGRYDWVEASSGSSSVSLDDVQEDTVRDEKFSPRVGLVYQLWPWLSLYGNYVESLGTTGGGLSSAQGSPLPAQEGQQYEVGLKTEFFDGRLSSTLAFYHLTKSNLPAADLSTQLPNDAIPIGEARSRGIELDISGQLTDRLRLIGTYAFTDAKITKESLGAFLIVPTFGGKPGDPLPGAPDHQGSLWAKYEILPERFEVGTGVFLVGRSPGVIGSTVDAPGYVRWDAFAAYHFNLGESRLTAQVNVNNILDKEYFSASQFFCCSALYPGDPLTVLGSIRVEY